MKHYFDGHIAISGYPSMLHLFVNTFLDFDLFENFVYRANITVILSTDLFGCMNLTVLKMTTCYYFRFCPSS